MSKISWEDFEKVELNIGMIIDVQDFPEARIPAYKLWIDFGEIIGVKKSSAQITDLYSKEDLINKQIIAVTNFRPKQIGKFISEVLVTGFKNHDGSVVLSTPDKNTDIGLRLL